MNSLPLRKASLRPAFTLIEVITVIAIIMVLAAMTIGGLGYANKKAEIGRTEVFVASVSQALEQYRADNGFFPQGDGEANSSEQVYIALSGDGELEFDSSTQSVVVRSGYEPDGEADEEATVYLGTLGLPKPYSAKQARSKNYNARQSESGYVIVDAWDDKNDSALRQELFYRHDPSEDPSNPDLAKMNPPSDFDLWSLGPDGEGGPKDAPGSTGNKAERSDDIKNW